MSSMKLFNFKYAKQNLRKELGILTIIFLIIPLINIVVIYNYSISNYANIFAGPFSMIIIIMPNLIGMFLLPFVLSNILLGYVYSQKQVDFINSMPLSRKKIFLTNILIGIVYIILMQVFSLLLQTVIINVANINIVNFEMLFDMFLAMMIGYIFVFTVSALALAFTGNTVIQFVIVLLLLFLIPFIRILYFTSSQEYVYLVTASGEKFKYSYGFLDDKLPLYTTPIATVLSLMNNLSIYNVKSFIITIVLSIIYIAIGAKLFERRKMEEVGHSFLNTKIHLLVKAITLFPIIALVFNNKENLTIVNIGLAVCLTFGYYYLFDLLTSKKIKFKVTICAFLISSLLILGGVIGASKINENCISKENIVNQEDIKSITVWGNIINEGYSISGLDRMKFSEENMKFILDNLKPDTTIDADQIDYNWLDSYMFHTILELKNGKMIPAEIGITKEASQMVFEKMKNDEEFIKKVAENYEMDDKALIMSTYDETYSSLKNEDELLNEIKKASQKLVELEIQERIDELNYWDSSKVYYENLDIGTEIQYIYLTQYNNHEVSCVLLNLTKETKELTDKLIMFFNKVHKDNYEKLCDNNYERYGVKTSTFIRKKENGTIERGYIGFDVLENEEIQQLVKEEYLKEFDSSKPFYSFRSNHYAGTTFYTNNVEEVEKILKDYIVEETFYDPYQAYYE